MKLISQISLLCVLTVTGCSTTTTGGGGFYNLDAKGGDVSLAFDGTGTTDDSMTTAGDGQSGGDGAPNSDGEANVDGTSGNDALSQGPDGDAASLSDTGKPADDTTVAISDAGPDVIDFDTFFDPDTGTSPDATWTQDVAVGGGGLGFVFAHSSDTLYRMDASGFVKIGYFTFDKNAGSMTDIAMDKLGALYGVTFDDLFKCNSKTAACTWLASLPESFNGLTFVPAGTVKPNDEALIGIANSGTWNLIEVTGTTAKVSKLGSYGSYTSSGDAFSVESIGTFATVKDANSFGGTDILVQVDPTNGNVLKKIGDTGVSDLWGFAWFQGKFYGFSDDTNIYEVNTSTGKATISTAFKYPAGVEWWGAAVSTRAALD